MKRRTYFVLYMLLPLIPCICFGADFTIKGIVKDAHTGIPLENANISIEKTSIGTISNSKGRFVLTISQPGRYTIRVDYIGYHSEHRALKLIFDRKIDIIIALTHEVIEGESVTVTARSDVNRAVARKTPVAFTKLDPAEVRSNYTTGDLPDMIKDVPGVWTSSAGLGESEIMVRGFGSNRVRFMINDIPMNEPEDNRVYWSNWACLSAIAQSIEVHRGAGFTLYGPAAFGGSVHIETMGVGSLPGSSLRVSNGFYRRVGITEGNRPHGQMFDTSQYLVDARSAINYTYSLRMNSGPLFNGKLNLSGFFEYKTGDSYIYGTTYEGYSLGFELESRLRNHGLHFSFFTSPQVHNQAFALQDIDLLDTIGREYNRRNHSYQENNYKKPFFSLKHEWHISETQSLVNNLFYTTGTGADQTLVNDLFDVETGIVDYQPINYETTRIALGQHAAYLYENFGLMTASFVPMLDDEPCHPYNQHSFQGDFVGCVGYNFFTENHNHSWQRRNRRDHDQFGMISYYEKNFNEIFQIVAGGEGRVWRGHREAEIWRLRLSPGLSVQGRDIIWTAGEHPESGKLQSLYDFDTEVNNLSLFSRLHLEPFKALTVQAGGQFAMSEMRVIENPIRYLDVGSFHFFPDAYRTSADQINLDGTAKYSDDDYSRRYSLFSPWIGCNYNLTNSLNTFINIAISEREPAVLDWYDYAEGPVTARVNGKDLDSERASSLECGMAHNSLFIDTKLNYYYTKYDDKIETVTDINDIRRTMNAGRAVFQGIECEFKGKYDMFDFSGTATLARNRWQSMNVDSIFGASMNDVVGKVVPFAPERMLSASIGYRFGKDSGKPYHFQLRLSYWDRYFGTYTNDYRDADGDIRASRLPYFLDLSGQLSYTKKIDKYDFIFRVDVNNLLNRKDNFLRAQYTIDYTRNDDLAGKYSWYVLQAPLLNVFLTAEIAIL